ncbi:WD repeat-containing protein 47-like isoform X1 [Macrobrachium nipponense]|uniref:WD repeat-containing protein 47-like isoform X1 n=1 Tax=Macrobrachium nipponense TaxID=159736 RepID=UPI0030C8CEBC
MPSAHLSLREEDVVRLTLEFLQNRCLHISQLNVERETGIINGNHSDDALFLRQLILDGQWDDVLEFVQPLEAIDAFDAKKFHFIVLKYKYFELLCIKAEAPANPSKEGAVDELVKVLNELEKYAPNKDAYSQLCLYLTLPRLHEHADFRDWNPSGARVQCWTQIFPLVEKFLPAERRGGLAGNLEGVGMARNDRLIQLIIKGLLYESCVDYCQNQATGEGSSSTGTLKFPSLLAATTFSDSDLSLLSWLQSIPPDTFACPFEQKTLNVDVERLEKPSLEASWTEHLLVTPIKPRTFPHSAMPYSRPRATDIMSRSLNPNLDGLPFGLGSNRNSMALSTGDINMMSKSIASFHLTGKKTMNTSVDRLFDNENNVFTSSSYGDLPTIIEKVGQPKAPPRRARSRSPDKRQSTDSLNKPAFSDKVEKDLRDEKPGSPPTLPPKSSPTPPQVPPSNQGSNLQPPHHQQMPHPKQNVPLPPVPDGKAGHPPPLNPSMQQQQQQPLMPHIDNNNDRETGELFSIYQRRQQQLMYEHHPYGNNNINVMMNMGAVHPPNMNMNRGVRCKRLQRGYYNWMMPGVMPPPPMGNPNDAYNPSVQPPPYHQSYDSLKSGNKDSEAKPRFLAVTSLEDVQAVRCAEFHPSGRFYAVGSNSKTLRICAYPKLSDLREDHTTYQPTVLFKRTKHHKGSIYCLAWSPMGDLVATGSNDKTVKLMKFNADSCSVDGQEIELTMHDGTVRDMCFIEDSSNKSSLLISGGAGDCKIYVTDCATGTPFQALSGHTGHILALHTWGGAMFVSGSQDRTVRFWDLRTRGCVNVITPGATPTKPGAPVASLCVDPSGRLLVTGHEDSVCSLYDVRGSRCIQAFRPHSSDVRSIRFSPSAYYLLTAGYDNKLVLTDLQGDLTLPLPSVVVAEHQDKVISGRWHPSDFSFISTSADKMCTLWALPPV